MFIQFEISDDLSGLNQKKVKQSSSDTDFGLFRNVLISMFTFSDECCVNVEVSALLEHWLGWDHHNHHHSHQQVLDQQNNSSKSDSSSHPSSTMPTSSTLSWADRLVSHLVETTTHTTTDQDHPSIWVRKFCSEIGCDVLKNQDNNGKTLLHHLLSGKFVAQRTQLLPKAFKNDQLNPKLNPFSPKCFSWI